MTEMTQAARVCLHEHAAYLAGDRVDEERRLRLALARNEDDRLAIEVALDDLQSSPASMIRQVRRPGCA